MITRRAVAFASSFFLAVLLVPAAYPQGPAHIGVQSDDTLFVTFY
jgi:hypothetical protein